MQPRGFIAAGLIIACLCGAAYADDSARAKAAESITEAELRDHIFFLASDYLEGRMPGEQGYQIAARYAAAQFRAAGLKLFEFGEKQAGYLQPVPMQRLTFGPGNRLTILMEGTQETFERGDKYILIRPGEGKVEVTSPVPLFLGYGIHEPELGWDDLAGFDLAGRIVIFMPGTPMKDGKPVLPKVLNDEYGRLISGMRKKIKALTEKGAAMIIATPDFQITVAWNMLRDMMDRGAIGLAGGGGRGLVDSPVPVVLAHPDLIMLLFKERDYNPLNRKGECASFELDGVMAELSIDVGVEQFDSYNVVALVEGSDPELKHEYVTIGAHLDHLGARNGEVFNGADDDASGCAAVLEAAEAAALSPPRRSLIFVLYTAEEIGLLGSGYFVDNCPVPLEQIVANINLDMVGRSDAQPPGLFVIGSQQVCPELKQLVIETNERRVGMPLNFSTDESDPLNYFDRGDHINFYKKGIPVVFFSCGEHKDYHRPSDDAELIDYKRLHDAALLAYELLTELGNRDERICPVQ